MEALGLYDMNFDLIAQASVVSEGAMEHNMKIATLTAPMVVAGLLCACATTPSASLSQLKTEQVRRLAMSCYVDNDGLREFLGSGPVVSACRTWAEAQVR